MEKIKFSLFRSSGYRSIFIEEQEENKLLFEYYGDFPEEEKQGKILSYEQALKEIHQLLKNGFEIMAD